MRRGHGGLLVMACRSALNEVGIPTAFRPEGSRLDLPGAEDDAGFAIRAQISADINRLSYKETT